MAVAGKDHNLNTYTHLLLSQDGTMFQHSPRLQEMVGSLAKLGGGVHDVKAVFTMRYEQLCDYMASALKNKQEVCVQPECE